MEPGSRIGSRLGGKGGEISSVRVCECEKQLNSALLRDGELTPITATIIFHLQCSVGLGD